MLASLDRLDQLAAATEAYLSSTDLRPKDLADLIVAAGNLREKHVLASGKVLGDVTDALKAKRKVVEA